MYDGKNLVFFDDDPDGICSYLQLSRHCTCVPIVLKTTPHITSRFASLLLREFHDRLIILDIANIDQDFIDEYPKPIVWYDHHGERRERIEHHTGDEPTCMILAQHLDEYTWHSLIGSIADHHLPDLSMYERYAHLFPQERTLDAFMHQSPIGELIHIIAFSTKGTPQEAIRAIRLLETIKEPEDLLEGRTPEAIKLREKYTRLITQYHDIVENTVIEPVIECIYSPEGYSLTPEIANELAYRNPDSIIFVGRESTGRYRLSARCRNRPIRDILLAALDGLDGVGGGHENACGITIAAQDYPIFIDRVRAASGTSPQRQKDA